MRQCTKNSIRVLHFVKPFFDMPIKLHKSEFVRFSNHVLWFLTHITIKYIIVYFEISVLILISFMWPIKLLYEVRMSNKTLINMYLIMSKYI